MYTVTSLKTFRGTDGEGVNATLCRDGKAVAYVIDDGCGGDMHFEWVDWQAPLVAVNMVGFEGQPHTMMATPEEALFYKECEGKTWTNELDGEVVPFDIDHLMNIMIEKAINDRRVKRACKTKTVFTLRSDPDNIAFRAINRPFNEASRQALIAEFGDNLKEILNLTAA